METVQILIQELDKEFPLPDVYLKFRRFMYAFDATVVDFADLIESEPLLMHLIQAIEHNKFFGFHKNTDSLCDAISLIGIVQLHDILFCHICLSNFLNVSGLKTPLEKFWQRAIQRGIASKIIAKNCHLPGHNRLFTLGVLLEIGHAILLIKKPDRVNELLIVDSDKRHGLVQAERENFGFDFYQLGAELFRNWNLPEVYSYIAEYHLNPIEAKLDYQFQTMIIHLAQLFFESSNSFDSQLTVFSEFHPQFKFRVDDVKKEIHEETEEHMQEIFDLLTLNEIVA